MREMRRAARAVTAVTAALMALTACSGASGGSGDSEFNLEEADRGGSLVFGSRLADRTLDPVDSVAAYYTTELAPIFDTLMRKAPDGELEPGIATGYEILDPSTLALDLREGITFSDGTPLDAEAIRDNLLRVRDAASGELNAVMQQIDDVTVEGTHRVSVRLTAPVVSEFVETLYSAESMPVSPAQLASDPESVDNAPIGSGPYEVVEFVPNQRIELVRKDDHWDADNYPIKNLTFQNVQDGAPMVTALAAGDIEMSRTGDPSMLESLERNPKVSVTTTPGTTQFYLNFCKSRPPLENPEAREAIALAIDRGALADAATGGEGEAAYQAFPRDSANFNPAAVTEFDPSAAERLLDGAPLEFTVKYATQVASSERVGEIIQAQLAEVGIKINLQPTESPAQLFTPDTDAILIPSGLPGIQRVSRQLGPDSAPNVCGYDDPAFNELTATVAAADPESDEAKQAWHAIAALISDSQLFIPLFFQASITAFDNSKVNSEAFQTSITDFRYVYVK